MLCARLALSFAALVSLSAAGVAQSGWSLQGFMPPGAEEGAAAVWCPTRQSILVVTKDKIFEGVGGAWSQVASYSGYSQCISTIASAAYWDGTTNSLVFVAYRVGGGLVLASWQTGGVVTFGASVPGPYGGGSAAFYDQASAKGLVIIADGHILEVPSGGTPVLVTPPTLPFISFNFSNSFNGNALRSACFDVHRRRVVALIGAPQAQVWEYDIALRAWFQGPAMPQSFALRGVSTLGYDELRRVTVIFGGWPTDSLGAANWELMPFNDVWHYDRGQVYQAAPGTSPVGRRAGSFVWNAARQELWLVGGANNSNPGGYGCSNLRDLWSYIPGQAGVDYTFFGNGCAGGAGTPYLELLPNTLPFAGRPFSLMVKNAPFFAPVFMLVGASDQSWYGNPLPLQLAPIGAPGCSLLTGPDVVHPTTNLFGTALWTATLPAGLAGATIYNQGVILDASANSLGLTLTNGGRAIVGR